MNRLTTPFLTTEDLAHALHVYAAPGEAKGFTARPWSPYKAQQGLWLLLPTTEWPAYHLGKFCVNPLGDLLESNPSPYLVGFYIEKGIGPSAAPVFLPKQAQLVMNERWPWFSFLEAMRSGEADRIARQVQQRSGQALTVLVSLHYSSPKDDFANREKLRFFHILFEHFGPTLSISENFEDFKHLEGISSFGQLASHLDTLDKPDWVWLDLMMGLRLEPTVGAEANLNDLWHSACTPWRKWFC